MITIQDIDWTLEQVRGLHADLDVDNPTLEDRQLCVITPADGSERTRYKIGPGDYSDLDFHLAIDSAAAAKAQNEWEVDERDDAGSGGVSKSYVDNADEAIDTARLEGDDANNDLILAEANTRGSADADLQNQLTGLADDLDNETQNRVSAINTEVTNRNTAIAAAVVGLFDYRGNYDASGNTFPASGGSGSAGAILKGDIYRISVVGTLGGELVGVGSLVAALTDTPGQTTGNWAITDANTVNAATQSALDGKPNAYLNGTAQTKIASFDRTVSSGNGTITIDLTATTPAFASARIIGAIAANDGGPKMVTENDTTLAAYVVTVYDPDGASVGDGEQVRITFIGT